MGIFQWLFNTISYWTGAADQYVYVREIADARTLVCLDPLTNEDLIVILANVDPPEWDQPYGKMAYEYLAQTVLGKMIKIIVRSEDKKTSRVVAHVYYRRGK